MSQDLSQAFGRPATSSLRGLLPPRVGARWSGAPGDEGTSEAPAEWEDDLADDEPDDDEWDEEPTAPPAAPDRQERPRTAARRAAAASGRPTASSANRRWGRVRVTSRDHADLLVLLTLCQGPADGRGVITRLRETSEGVLDAPEGTVYVTLHRLARKRLLGRRLDPASGRRLYALTDAGVRATRARLREWDALTRGMDAVARAAE
jgi:PadR family transcriptional regulator PadR